MILEDLYYSETHEWIKVDDDIATVGITDFAQNELGDIVYIELPAVGDEVTFNESFGTIEAVKAVEDMLSPISGEVVEINEALEDQPELINKSAFKDGWIIKIKISDKSEIDNLMDSKQYTQHIED
jgi:glycine cleavage system H protein